MLTPDNKVLTEELKSKWAPILEHDDLAPIKDNYRKTVTAILLENQQNFLKEDAPVNNYGDGNIGSFDPVLISLVRRAAPMLIAYDIASVQPMTMPTGLIFAMKSRYVSQTGTEALFNEANTNFSGTAWNTNASAEVTGSPYSNAVASGSNFAGTAGTDFAYGTPMTTAGAEQLGDATGNNDFNQMAFSIDKVTVTAKSRALKAEYTTELAQDLKAVHGLDAEAELANILSQEIISEINREIIRTIYYNAQIGCASGTTATAGLFNLDVDSNGRWSVEKFKGLLFQLEREANEIGRQTRRGKGNFIVCSADVASALNMAGVLDYAPAMATDINVDPTVSTFAGVINGKTKVYVDPYFTSTNGYEYAMVGYRGASPYDAGFFYAPYVPLQMVRAVGENNFQPRIGFKTRYGTAVNPFVNATGAVVAGANYYYRRFAITNIM